MKRIYSAASLPEAHLFLHRLQAEGIQAMVFNENAQSGIGELPFTHAYPEIWIENPRDEQNALRLLREIESDSKTALNRPCPDCGEANPSTFEFCWHCGCEFDPA